MTRPSFALVTQNKLAIGRELYVKLHGSAAELFCRRKRGKRVFGR